MNYPGAVASFNNFLCCLRTMRSLATSIVVASSSVWHQNKLCWERLWMFCWVHQILIFWQEWRIIERAMIERNIHTSTAHRMHTHIGLLGLRIETLLVWLLDGVIHFWVCIWDIRRDFQKFSWGKSNKKEVGRSRYQVWGSRFFIILAFFVQYRVVLLYYSVYIKRKNKTPQSWLNFPCFWERLKLKDFQSKLNNALSTEQLKLLLLSLRVKRVGESFCIDLPVLIP